MNSVNCPNCGAELKVHPGVTKIECEYCGYEVDFVAQSQAERPTDKVAPLAVTQEDVHDAVRRYMTTGLETTDDLAASAEFRKVDFYYVPTWFLKGSYSADWSASFGFDKRVERRRYNKASKRWETNTVTETTWRPHSGNVRGQYSYFCAALQNQDIPMGSVAAELIRETDEVSLQNITARNSYDVKLLPAGLSASETFDLRARKNFEEKVERQVKRHKMGDHQKQWHWHTTIETKDNTLFYLPLAVVTYAYRGQERQLAAAGLHANNIRVAGDLPKDEAKVELVKNAELNKWLSVVPLFVFAVLLLIGVFREPPFSVFTWNMFCGFLAAVVSCFGGIQFINSEMKKFEDSAVELRKKYLIRRKAMNGELSCEDEAAAKESQTPGKCYEPNVKPRWGLTFVVSAIVFVLSAWPLETLF